MPIIIDREQRDAVHDALLTHLSGVGDIHLMLDSGDVAAARRYRREQEDTMRMLDDLGWGMNDPGEHFELTMEPHALARVVRRLHKSASAELQQYLSQPLDEAAEAKRYGIASIACGSILAQLGEFAREPEAS